MATPEKIGKSFSKYVIVIVLLLLVAAVFVVLTTSAGNFLRPEKPVLTQPADASKEVYITKFPYTISGSTTIQTRLIITVDGAEVAARDQGQEIFWTYTIDKALEPGKHTVTITAINYAGIKSEPIELTVVVPQPPQITEPHANQTVPKAELRVTGTAEVGSQVNLFRDGEFVTTVQADATGTFTFEHPMITLGTHTISVESVKTLGNFGNTSQSIEFIVVQ